MSIVVEFPDLISIIRSFYLVSLIIQSSLQ